jgi:hypothetical protein
MMNSFKRHTNHQRMRGMGKAKLLLSTGWYKGEEWELRHWLSINSCTTRISTHPNHQIKRAKLLASQYSGSIPQLAFFAGPLTAMSNRWGRNKINLLHSGATIKIVDLNHSIKRPLSPSFDFKTQQFLERWQTTSSRSVLSCHRYDRNG